MIDVSTEELVPLNQVAKRLPTRPHVSTLYRWVHPGVRGTTLEVVKLGGRAATSVEALERFFEACTTNGDKRSSPSPRRRTRRQRERDHKRAERKLDAAGVK